MQIYFKSGQHYATFVQEHIFKPLGMHDSGMLHNTPIIMHRAQGYHRVGTDLQNAHYSETEFFMDSTDAQISFVKDTHGIVTQLIGHQDGQEFVAKKV